MVKREHTSDLEEAEEDLLSPPPSDAPFRFPGEPDSLLTLAMLLRDGGVGLLS
jgi:hypothetical protein